MDGTSKFLALYISEATRIVHLSTKKPCASKNAQGFNCHLNHTAAGVQMQRAEPKKARPVLPGLFLQQSFCLCVVSHLIRINMKVPAQKSSVLFLRARQQTTCTQRGRSLGEHRETPLHSDTGDSLRVIEGRGCNNSPKHVRALRALAYCRSVLPRRTC